MDMKTLIIMELIQHVTDCRMTKGANQHDYFRLRGPGESCVQNGCMEILDVGVFESEVVCILSAILYSEFTVE